MFTSYDSVVSSLYNTMGAFHLHGRINQTGQIVSMERKTFVRSRSILVRLIALYQRFGSTAVHVTFGWLRVFALVYSTIENYVCLWLYVRSRKRKQTNRQCIGPIWAWSHCESSQKWEPVSLAMNHSPIRLNYDLGNKNEINHHSWKEHLKISEIAKFSSEIF